MYEGKQLVKKVTIKASIYSLKGLSLGPHGKEALWETDWREHGQSDLRMKRRKDMKTIKDFEFSL